MAGDACGKHAGKQMAVFNDIGEVMKSRIVEPESKGVCTIERCSECE